MYLRNLIAKLLAAPEGNLFASDGTLVPKALWREEYILLREGLAVLAQGEKPVAISMGRGNSYVLAMMACMELGVPFLPLDPKWPIHRTQKLLKRVEPCLLLDEEKYVELTIRQKLSGQPGSLAPLRSQCLYIIGTSGTSDEPKAVEIGRESFEQLLKNLDSFFSGLTASHRQLSIADFTFDMSLLDLGLFLLKRCDLYLSRSEKDLFALADEIARYKINGMITVPYNIKLLLADAVHGRSDYSSLRHLVIAGSRFTRDLHEDVFRSFGKECSIYNAYGPTEVCCITHIRRLTGDVRDLSGDEVSIGVGMGAVECLLVSDDGQHITGSGQSGELLLGGPQVMRGYVANSEDTRLAIAEIGGRRYFRSKDRAFLNDHGDFFVTGRLDETVKRRGYRINLHEIDALLLKCSSVSGAASVALSEHGVEISIVSFVVTNKSITTEGLMKEFGDYGAKFQLPNQIIFLKALPVTENGKIDQKALLQLLSRYK